MYASAGNHLLVPQNSETLSPNSTKIGIVIGSEKVTYLKCSATSKVSLAFVHMTIVVQSTRFKKYVTIFKYTPN